MLTNIDALIPLLGGTYCTHLGFRGGPASSAKLAMGAAYARWGRFMKIGRPRLMLMSAQLFSKAAG